MLSVNLNIGNIVFEDGWNINLWVVVLANALLWLDLRLCQFVVVGRDCDGRVELDRIGIIVPLGKCPWKTH